MSIRPFARAARPLATALLLVCTAVQANDGPTGPELPCVTAAADGAVALSTRPECRQDSMQALRSAVHAMNEPPPDPPRRPTWRQLGSGIRTTALHRLAPLPGRYYGQR